MKKKKTLKFGLISQNLSFCNVLRDPFILLVLFSMLKKHRDLHTKAYDTAKRRRGRKNNALLYSCLSSNMNTSSVIKTNYFRYRKSVISQCEDILLSHVRFPVIGNLNRRNLTDCMKCIQIP